MAGAPVGNQNAAKAKRMLTDALRRELTQNPEDVRLIARKLIESAKAGEPWAQTLIHDRVDGKAPQPLTGGDEDDAPIRTVTRIELVDLDARSSERGSDRAPPEA
jgi:hypothetical protein